MIESSNKLAAHAKGLLELLKKESNERKREKDTPQSEVRCAACEPTGTMLLSVMHSPRVSISGFATTCARH